MADYTKFRLRVTLRHDAPQDVITTIAYAVKHGKFKFDKSGHPLFAHPACDSLLRCSRIFVPKSGVLHLAHQDGIKDARLLQLLIKWLSPHLYEVPGTLIGVCQNQVDMRHTASFVLGQ